MTEVPGEMLLEAAIAFAKRGWHVLPLKPRDKIPLINEWQNMSSTVVEIIERWWQQYPEANVGVQLGPRSGLIDVECDTQEAEQNLAKLFDGNMPVVPTYQASRGKHRLFKYGGALPEKAVVKVHGIEFRLGSGGLGAQSVFPPSRHPSGSTYQWLIDPDEAPLVELTPYIKSLIFAESKRTGGSAARSKWNEVLDGASEGSRHTSAAQLIGRILADLKDPFDNAAASRMWALVQLWNDQNKPPLDEKELRSTFLDILRADREQARDDEFATAFSKYVPVEEQHNPLPPVGDDPDGVLPPDDGEKPRELSEPREPAWRLVVVESRPRSYKLYSHLWRTKTDGGYVMLQSSDQMLSGQAIRRAALEQADLWLPKDFIKTWDGTAKEKGLAAQLIDTCERESAPAETRRDLVVAGYLYEAIRRPRVIDGEKEKDPDAMGNPTQLPTGEVVFKFERVWEPMKKSDDQITRNELSDLLKRLGAGIHQWGAKGSRQKFKELKPEAIKALHDMIGLVE